MNIFAQLSPDGTEPIQATPPPADEGMLKFIAIGAVLVFIALVIAILVAKRK